jgi:hypothetical protein
MVHRLREPFQRPSVVTAGKEVQSFLEWPRLRDPAGREHADTRHAHEGEEEEASQQSVQQCNSPSGGNLGRTDLTILIAKRQGFHQAGFAPLARISVGLKARVRRGKQAARSE